jgi:hypothetical protein
MRTQNWMNHLQGINVPYVKEEGLGGIEEQEEINEGKAAEMIKELIDTDWGGDNAAQGKAVQLLRGLAFSDEPQANAFMKELDKVTSGMNSDDYK